MSNDNLKKEEQLGKPIVSKPTVVKNKVEVKGKEKDTPKVAITGSELLLDVKKEEQKVSKFIDMKEIREAAKVIEDGKDVSKLIPDNLQQKEKLQKVISSLKYQAGYGVNMRSLNEDIIALESIVL